VTEKPLMVSVIGGSSCSTVESQAAETLGGQLAGLGAVVVCGGLGGIMEAVCRGARQRGGITVGILPGLDPRRANPYVLVPIPTGLGEARNWLVVAAGDVVIAVGGGVGTLSEIALAKKAGKRVVGLWSWHASRPGEPDLELERAETPEQAVALALDRRAASPVDESESEGEAHNRRP
jgi:uncharacterized protein (TIGR00725 family)